MKKNDNGTKNLDAINRGRRCKWWRRRGGKKSGFKYFDHFGKQVTDEKQIERIKKLVIPPAWKHVRICPNTRAGLQAIGIDTAGRIQYKYSLQFSAKQQAKKFSKIERFGEFLPKLRKLTNEYITLEGYPKEKVLAVVMRLINDLYIRVGSEKSVKEYKTFGVTTLRNRHLTIENGCNLNFNFVGKHSIRHRRLIVDEDLATIMTDLKAMGGSKLFNYLDGQGKPRPVTPRDVNDFLKTATSPEFSAKDFRTWGATVLAATELAEIGAGETKTQTKKNIVEAVKKVAEHLGNTPAVCRSSYIHPAVIEAYEQGITIEEFRPRKKRTIEKLSPELSVEEIAVMRLLEKAKNNGK
ncbi:MAG: DNA topoisomerase IB [Acidobacteriota bacterium]|nr:DNA topoisomerase IB [Acidobacteriota bacterium]